MYKNKNNGKIASDVIFLMSRVYFVIDGIRESLEINVFKQYYELIK